MGSLAGSPWHFRKIIGRSGLQASKTWGRLPPADCPSGRLCEGGLGLKISKKKAPRGPAPRSRPQEGRLQEAAPLSRRPRSCPQNLHPHNGDETGRGYSETCHPRIPEHAWPKYAIRAAITRSARHCCHIDHDVTHGEPLVRPVGGGSHPSWRHPKAAGPPPVGLGYGRFPVAGQSTPSKEAPH